MKSLFLLLMLAGSSIAQVDVPTRRYDNARSGVNDRETSLTQANVRARFTKLWTLYADAKIMAQPLYVSNLMPPPGSIVGETAKKKCANGCNAVIFATMKGTLYAYMADEKPTNANDTLLWATYLSDGNACHCGATGPRDGNGEIDMWGVDDPWWGILSTPVIERATNSLYAVTWTNDQQYRIYNLDIRSGAIKMGPVAVQGSIGGQTFALPGAVQRRKQRAGLLLHEGKVYVAFGGDNPAALAGWLFVYDAATLGLKTIWSPTPKGRNGGIWMAGDAPAADKAGNIYLQTGDGDVNPAVGSYGNSLVKLRYDEGSMAVTGYFSPCNQMLLLQCDLDQGSSGPLLVEPLVIAGGKNGMLYAMRTDKMAGYRPGPYAPTANMCMSGQQDCGDGPELLQKWQASQGHIHSAPIYWKGPGERAWLYLMGEGDHVQAFPQAGGKFNIAGVKRGSWTQPKLNNVPVCQTLANHGMWMPGGQLSVSSNGAAGGTGIVWAIVPANGDSNSCRGVQGMLLALSAEDVTKELWRSQGKDSLGLIARFNPPVVANGKVFVGTAGDSEPMQRFAGPRPAPGPANYGLVVYGLR